MGEYFSYISFIPKVALISLFLVTLLIVYELYNLFKIRKNKEPVEKKEEETTTEPYKFYVVENKEEPKVKKINLKYLWLFLLFFLLLGSSAAGVIIIRKKIKSPVVPKIPIKIPFFNSGNLVAATPIPMPTKQPKPTLMLISPTIISSISSSLKPSPSIQISKPVSTVSATITKKISPTLPKTATPTIIKPSLMFYQIKNNVFYEIKESELKTLLAGDKIRIIISNSQSYNSALFKINDIPLSTYPSVKRTSGNELYEEYTLPVGKVDFKINVELYNL